MTLYMLFQTFPLTLLHRSFSNMPKSKFTAVKTIKQEFITKLAWNFDAFEITQKGINKMRIPSKESTKNLEGFGEAFSVKKDVG